LGFFALDLLRQDRPAHDSHYTKKNTSGAWQCRLHRNWEHPRLKPTTSAVSKPN